MFSVTSTGSATTKDWRAATKDIRIGAYLPGEVTRTAHKGAEGVHVPAPEVLERQDPNYSDSDFMGDVEKATRRSRTAWRAGHGGGRTTPTSE